MKYNDSDIDFGKISPQRFEELCYDLVQRSGFYALKWRRGGADSGRDIEANLRFANPLVGQIDEHWLFECKRYSGGVPPDDLTAKIAWADALQPDHFVFFISSYPTAGTREWLDRIRPQKSYAIHVLEEKDLKTLILSFPDLIEAYFQDATHRVLASMMENWSKHSILPTIEALNYVLVDLDLSRLQVPELTFLWYAIFQVEDSGSRGRDFLADNMPQIKTLLVEGSAHERTSLEQVKFVEDNGMKANLWLSFRKPSMQRVNIESRCEVGCSVYRCVYSCSHFESGDTLEVFLDREMRLAPIVIYQLDGSTTFETIKTRVSAVDVSASAISTRMRVLIEHGLAS
ncbi:restriction endonuclease [Burkholderia plantarii]|uniref:Restriction endonuclease type IV Mrr domain-containing protein n=1 Tax=Burkholderia plantarii TaxID=41899 RepID=A0A0B6RUB5_BURPL|nr:restriction endonuclease [Burkholderia plantarii]AJK48912.1 hypothetical protein BGL_2c08280 [Burkholderia plantarii]